MAAAGAFVGEGGGAWEQILRLEIEDIHGQAPRVGRHPGQQTDGADGADPAAERRSILERLARKEISAEDAAAALRDLETSS